MSIKLILQTGALVGVYALIYVVFLLLPPVPALRNIDSFLPLHTIMETFSVVVSCMIFGIIWNTCDTVRARNIVLLGATFLAVGLLDFAHLMSYKGMPDFVTPSSPQKGILFWLAARVVAAVGMFAAAAASWKPLSKAVYRGRLLAVFLGFTAIVYWVGLWHPDWMPLFWEEGYGLTRAKLVLEYMIIAANTMSAFLFYRLMRRDSVDFDCRGLFLGTSVLVISELCFTSYSTVTDAFNMLGHLYKVVAYLFLYRALFQQLVRDPYSKLARSRHEIWLEKECAEITLQSIMDGVIATDADGNVVSMNPVAMQLTGWSNEAALGQPLSRVFSVLDETDHSPIENPVEKCLRERRAILLSNHAMIVSTFGTKHSIEQLASPIINKNGNIIGVVMVFRDVAERRQAQDELGRQERSLREAQAIARLGSWEWDIISSQQAWSEELFRILGFLPHSIKPTNETFLTLLHPDDRASVLRTVEQAINNSSLYDIEYRIRHRDGTIRHIHSRGEVQCDQAGNPIKMMGTMQDITTQKQAQELLHKSKAEIEDLYENAPCGYHSLDSDGVIQRINQTELDWLGYSREELIGKMRFTDLLAADSSKTFYENYPRFKRNGIVRDLEYEMVRKDGSRFFVSLSATAIYDSDGNYLTSRSTMSDITESKKAKLALIEKEESLSKAQAIAHLGSWEWNIESGRQSWSDESFRIFGFQPGEIAADYASFMNIVLPEDREIIVENVQSALNNPSSYCCEFRIRRPNGDIRYILGQGEVVLDQGGKPIHMTGTNLDITERKQSENELRQRESEQRRQAEIQTAILDALPANLALIDGNGFIVAVNQRWKDFARENGLSEDGVGIGCNYLQACYSESGDDDGSMATVDGLRSVLSGACDQYVREYACHSPDRQRWYRMLAAPLSASERLGAVVMHIDITESWQHKNQIEALNQKLEQRVAERTSQLETANKELEAFSYSVSHDLRAPLRVIDGFAQILAADYGASMTEAARRHLDRILYAAARMGELIDDLLQLSRVSRGDLQFKSVNLSLMASEILAEFKRREPERKTRLTIAPDQCTHGDTHLLKIALENLLANAWKFTRNREVTEIEFGGLQDAEKTIYYVRDNGVGFNQKYGHKLFGAFQRLHSEDEFEGTGIGLATVQRIISRHGGTVWAESKLGEGAIFFFRI